MAGTENRHLSAHFRSAEQILSHFTGEEPFPLFLRSFFRANPKFGSRDRRVVSALCYDAFRLGVCLADAPVRERILAGHLLCAQEPKALIEAERPEWLSCLDKDLDGRVGCLTSTHPGFKLQDLFPFPDELSPGIDGEAFIRSHLRQPDLFIRLRPRRTEAVKRRIEESGIHCRYIGEAAVALPNGTDTTPLGTPDRDFVIQDLSSQRTAGFLPEPSQLPDRPMIWDACAGSGGKSILASDRYPRLRLLATDARPGILANLVKRFRTAGVADFEAECVDLNRIGEPTGGGRKGAFDLVIADVPCSGSGTWSRAPWEMAGFQKEGIDAYRKAQEGIVKAVVPAVGSGGYLLYITCSAYRRENEGMSELIAETHGFKLVRQGVLEGHPEGADTMFAALFISTP